MCLSVYMVLYQCRDVDYYEANLPSLCQWWLKCRLQTCLCAYVPIWCWRWYLSLCQCGDVDYCKPLKDFPPMCLCAYIDTLWSNFDISKVPMSLCVYMEMYNHESNLPMCLCVYMVLYQCRDVQQTDLVKYCETSYISVHLILAILGSSSTLAKLKWTLKLIKRFLDCKFAKIKCTLIA